MTKKVKIDYLNIDERYIKEAADILINGGLVIIPTETVYGIAANMQDKKALERLYEIKKRPSDKLFSVHIDNKDKVETLAKDIPALAYKLIERFWPGPLTLILKSMDNATIGIRMPDDEIALKVIEYAQVPVVCPSANLSGKPAPNNFQEALKDLDGLVDLAIDAGPTQLQRESSVVDLTQEPPKILREGAIRKEDIEKLVKTKTVLFICTGNTCRSVMAQALMEKRLKEKGQSNVEVISAGVMMMEGLPASESTRKLLEEEGIDVSNHRSHTVTREMIRKSDIILVMEHLQEERILQLCPEVKNRVFLLKEFAKISDNEPDIDISDPMGASDDFYGRIFSIIKEAIERIIDII